MYSWFCFAFVVFIWDSMITILFIMISHNSNTTPIPTSLPRQSLHWLQLGYHFMFLIFILAIQSSLSLKFFFCQHNMKSLFISLGIYMWKTCKRPQWTLTSQFSEWIFIYSSHLAILHPDPFLESKGNEYRETFCLWCLACLVCLWRVLQSVPHLAVLTAYSGFCIQGSGPLGFGGSYMLPEIEPRCAASKASVPPAVLPVSPSVLYILRPRPNFWSFINITCFILSVDPNFVVNGILLKEQCPFS